MNVITGERYKVIPAEVKNYIRGMYGKPPGEISEEVKVKALGKNWKDEIITGRPADFLEDEYPQAEEEVKKLGGRSAPEDVLTYIFYPKVAREFWSRK
jgi:pyruvate/oxaloacetate carboxyltransferase